MVKFSKQMELQLVPEWRHKFCDYWQLKKDIKRIKLRKSAPPPHVSDCCQSTLGVESLAKPENRSPSLDSQASSTTWTPLSTFTRRTIHPWAHEVIIKVVENTYIASKDTELGCMYETQVLEGISIDEQEKEFFKRLDEELNKVNRFFFAKEREFLERAEILSRQLTSLTEIHRAYNDTLIAQDAACHLLNSKYRTLSQEPSCVMAKHGPYDLLVKMIAKLRGLLPFKADSSAKTGAMECEENSCLPLNRQRKQIDEDATICQADYAINIHTRKEEEPIIYEKGRMVDPKSWLCEGKEDWALDGLFEYTHTKDTNYEEMTSTCAQVTISNLINSIMNQRSSLESKKRQDHEGNPQKKDHMMKIRSNMKGTLYSLASQNSFKASMDNMKRSMRMSMRMEPFDENCVSLRKIKHARKMLRTAFVEFYRGLGLLQTFSSLNILALIKILKKYDKVTGRQISSTYMKVVEKAYFNTSDKVAKMKEDVERLFTEHFAKDDEKKAMMLLRPMQNETPHTITFFLGLFSGCSIALLMAFVILLQTSKLPTLQGNEVTYLETTYQAFGMLLLLLLHMYLYGWNVYVWRKTRINYAFIFEFAPKTELRHREILLVCTGLTCIVATGMLIHLLIYTSTIIQINPDVIPLSTILVLLLLLICPLDVCYRSGRMHFIKCIKRIALAPLYKVFFVDFFLADQLTSQITALRSLQFIMCYYFGGFFQIHDARACASNEFRFFAYLISFLPYWWRLLQCLRRWIEEGDQAQLANGCKYLSAMVAAGARISYSFYPTTCWLVIFVITSSFATLYQMYWDVVRDWGFLQPHSRHPWLRDHLLLKNKFIYYFSIALNFVLRFAWLQQVTHWQLKSIKHGEIDLFFAALEVIRRGHWNFYRLENEHMNNVHKYRAIKLVALPFPDENFQNHV